jgi:hypothetical protein
LSARSGRSSKGAKSIPLTREALAKLRLKARRRGVWFRDLKQSERKLLDLTIRVVQRVHSFVLAKLVSRIVGKLCEAMESRVYRLMRTEGRRMAERLSNIAQSWGYEAAKSWVKDRGFMQYLTVINLSFFKN